MSVGSLICLSTAVYCWISLFAVISCHHSAACWQVAACMRKAAQARVQSSTSRRTKWCTPWLSMHAMERRLRCGMLHAACRSARDAFVVQKTISRNKLNQTRLRLFIHTKVLVDPWDVSFSVHQCVRHSTKWLIYPVRTFTSDSKLHHHAWFHS